MTHCQLNRPFWPFFAVVVFALLGVGPLLGEEVPIDDSEWGGVWLKPEQIAQAKAYALANNRPLLVVAGAKNCGHCGELERRVLHTPTFLNYAKEKKIVLLENRSDILLTPRLLREFGTPNGMHNTYPYIFLFRVNPGADLTKSDFTSLGPSDVTLLTVSSGMYAGAASCFNYVNATNINGVKIEKEANWTPGTFIQVLESFFPNQFWNSLTYSGGGETPGGGGDDDDPLPGGGDDDNQPPASGEPEVEVPIDDSEWGGVWLQPEQIAQAKTYALANNRPLLVVAGAKNCGHCGELERRVLHTSTFLNYAKEKKIVLLENRSDILLTPRLLREFGTPNGMHNTYPYVFLFTVNPDADLIKSDFTALGPSDVTLLTVSSGLYAGAVSCFNYVNATYINGVKIEKEANWTPGTFIQVLESFFPNQQWATITPPTLPTISGYEHAADLGVITSLETAPAPKAESTWITYAVNESLTAANIERWYKFTGYLGRRYVFSAKDMNPAATEAKISFSVYESAMVGGVRTPTTPALFSVTSTGFDALDRGVQVDMPAGTAGGQIFYLRIKSDRSPGAAGQFFTLKVHEALASPPVGSVANPHWQGAVPGQWTMDGAAAEAAALNDARPVIYLVSGLLWCPYCVALEQQVVHTPEFAAATSDAYLVLLDNRDRYGNGPSLLRDNTGNGYLQRNGITTAAAESKLANNIVWQDNMALPGADTWGTTGNQWKKIGYPTLVYRTPISYGGTRSVFTDLVTIGRISGDYDPASVIGKLEELAILAASGFQEEFSNAKTSSRLLASPEDQTASRIGGSMATAEWWQFTVSADQGVSLTIEATAPPAGATITMTVYAEDGVTPLKTISGPAANKLSLEFSPPTSETSTFMVKVSAGETTRSFPYTLTFKEVELSYRLKMAVAEQFVSRGQTEAKVEVLLQTLRANEQEVRFQYRVRVSDGENPLPDMLFTAVDWTDVSFSAEEKEASSKVLTASFVIPAQASIWSDSLDFVVEINSIADGNCQIDSSAATTTVKVVSTAIFAPRPTTLNYDLIQGLPVHGLILPVCLGSPEPALIGGAPDAMPPGLQLVNNLADPDFPHLEVQGTPTELDGVGKLVQISLFTDMEHIDTLDLYFTVSPPPASAAIRNFTGYLTANYDETDALAIRGDILLENALAEANGTITARVSTQDTEFDSMFTADGWSGFQPDGEMLILEATNAENASLYLQIDKDGAGVGTYMSPAGNVYAVQFAAVSTTPDEYVGYYTVALREYLDGDAYAFHGWLQVDVAANGLVTYQGEMVDGSIIAPRTTYMTPSKGVSVDVGESPYGELIFFQPLYWADNLDKWAGRLAGRLAICPLSSRGSGEENDAWVSACIGDVVDSPVWEKSSQARVSLDPCGTMLAQERSITDQVGIAQPYFYFSFQENDFAEKLLLPDHVLLEEKPDQQYFQVITDGILGAGLGNLEYNPQKGTFAAVINVMSVVEGSTSGLLTSQEVTLKGILTPITSDCCRETANLAVGYGYFTVGENSYVATLNAQAVEAADKPVLQKLAGQTTPEMAMVFSTAAVELTLMAPSQKVLRRQASDAGEAEIFLHDWSALSQTPEMDFTLLTCHQEFTALEDGKSESDRLVLPLRQSSILATFAVPAENEELQEGVVELATGWHLLAVPWDVELPVDYQIDARCVSLHADSKTYLPASATGLQTGQAFWIFLSPGESLSLPGVVLDASTLPPSGAPGWRFMANPGTASEGQAWFWNGDSFSTEEMNNGAAIESKWRGVWFY